MATKPLKVVFHVAELPARFGLRIMLLFPGAGVGEKWGYDVLEGCLQLVERLRTVSANAASYLSHRMAILSVRSGNIGLGLDAV